jgi:predicted DNA-binding transcriptional regulator YafY
LDFTYLILEWFFVNALWKGGGRRSAQLACPEPLYPEAERLEFLRAALESGVDVQIVYLAASSGEVTQRVVTPESLHQAKAGHWLLTGYDHLREERRTFRVGNMKEAVPLAGPPSSPDLTGVETTKWV